MKDVYCVGIIALNAEIYVVVVCLTPDVSLLTDAMGKKQRLERGVIGLSDYVNILKGAALPFQVNLCERAHAGQKTGSPKGEGILTARVALFRLSICEGREFIDCPARYKYPIENMLLKLRTKVD